jgi:hypothetical protein
MDNNCKVSKTEIEAILKFCENANEAIKLLVKQIIAGKRHPGYVIQQLELIQDMVSNAKSLTKFIVKDNS